MVPFAAPSAIPTGSDDPEFFKVKLLNVTASYGQERWKASPNFYGSNPAGGLGNATGQFDGAVGYRVILKVQLVDENLQPVNTMDPELPFVNLTASISTPKGPARAYVQRESCVGVASCSAVFYLNFDMDGSDYAPPGGQPLPALAPGLKYVHVDIKKGSGGSPVPAGTTDLVFDYVAPAQEIRIPRLGTTSYTSDVPDTIFRLFNDIGWGRNVRMVHEPVRPDDSVEATYYFSVPQATVRWYALAAERFCQPPSCVPGGAGSIEIHRKLLDTLQTDATGAVTFSSPAQDLLRFTQKNYGAAVVVLAAVLEPQQDLGATLPDEYQFGSPAIHTGATESVVAISNANARVARFDVNTTAYEGTKGRAPDPVSDAVLQANALEVTVYDDGGGSRAGDAVAFLPNTPDSTVITRGDLAPHNDPVLANKYRLARLAVKPIQDQGIMNYRVMTLLYSSPSEFYGHSYADRGYILSLAAPVTEAGQRGTVWINVTSVTTNYDLRSPEAGFNLHLVARVNVPDLRINATETFDIAEGQTVSRPFALRADRVADVNVQITATTGDTLVEDLTITARFVEAPPKKSFVDRIPGFEVPALLAALGIIVWLARRR